jgi:hypothetical protein
MLEPTTLDPEDLLVLPLIWLERNGMLAEGDFLGPILGVDFARLDQVSASPSHATNTNQERETAVGVGHDGISTAATMSSNHATGYEHDHLKG